MKVAITTNDHDFSTKTAHTHISLFSFHFFSSPHPKARCLLPRFSLFSPPHSPISLSPDQVQLTFKSPPPPPSLPQKTSLCKTSVGTSINESAAPNRILLFFWFSCGFRVLSNFVNAGPVSYFKCHWRLCNLDLNKKKKKKKKKNQQLVKKKRKKRKGGSETVLVESH